MVVASASAALYGITSFMATVHRDWSDVQRTQGGADVEAVGPAAPDSRTGLDVPTRVGPAPPEPVAPPPVREGEPPSADPPAMLVAALRERRLTIPVEGVTAAALVPSFDEPRGTRTHEALDIMAPAGTPVVAVEDGTVAKLFTSEAGGLTIYQFDPSRSVAYYYAHLQGYAPGIEDGAVVRRGQVVGYVGSTGNADPSAPHLHFAIFRLGPERRWWEGLAVDPFLVLR